MPEEFDPRQLIVNFAEDNPGVQALKFIREDPEGFHFKLDEGNGMINFVYRVQSSDNKTSVIIKYGEETMRCLEEKVSLERQELEYNCLCLMQIIEPGSAPEPYCYDKKHQILAMSDMSDWDLLGTQLLMKRHVDLEAANALGRLLGKVHMETSRGNVTEERWEELKMKFEQEELKDFLKVFYADRQFIENDPVIYIDKENLDTFRKHVNEIKALELPRKISDLHNMQMCFIHGDCHFKSIFVKEEHVALFDFEFAFLGHPAFNMSFPIACYIVSCIFDERHVTDEQLSKGPSREGFKTACLQAIRNMLAAYLDTENEIPNSDEAQMKFLSDVALFTGCKLFALSNFALLDLFVDGLNDIDRRKMMDAGFRIMRAHEEVNTLEELINLVRNSF